MNKREILQAKRAKILKRVKSNPEAMKLLKERDVERAAKPDTYMEAIKTVNWLIGKVSSQFEDLEKRGIEGNERFAEVAKSVAEGIKDVEAALKGIKDADGSKDVLAELKAVKTVLRDLSQKKTPAPVVNVPAPVVNVSAPETKVLDQTKTEVLQETKYQEKAAKTLETLLEVLERVNKNVSGRQMVYIENRNLSDAIPVQLVDKRGKNIMDLNDLAGILPVGAVGGGGGGSVQFADGEDFTRTGVGTLAMWRGGSTFKVTSGTNPFPVQLRPSTTEATYGTPGQATVGTTSAAAIAANTDRKGLILVNTSSWPISIAFNTGTAVLYSGITIFPQGTWEMPSDGAYFTTKAINAIAAAASCNLAYQETT